MSARGALAAGWVSPASEHVAVQLDDAGRTLDDMAARTENVIARLRQSASELDELAAVMRRVEEHEATTRSRLQTHHSRLGELERARRHHADPDVDAEALAINSAILDLERTLRRLEYTRADVARAWDSACQRVVAGAGSCADALEHAGRRDPPPPQKATGLPWARGQLGQRGSWPPSTAVTTAGTAIEHARRQSVVWPVDLPGPRTSPVAIESWRSQRSWDSSRRADRPGRARHGGDEPRHAPGDESTALSSASAEDNEAAGEANDWSDRLATVVTRAWSASTFVFRHHPVLGPTSRTVARMVGWMQPHRDAAIEFLWDWSAAVTLSATTIALRRLTGPTTRHLLSPPRSTTSIGDGTVLLTDDGPYPREAPDIVTPLTTVELDQRNRAALEASIGALDERIARLEGLIDLLAVTHRSAFTAAHAGLTDRRTAMAAIIAALDDAETDGRAAHLLAWSPTDPDRLVVVLGDPVDADRIDVMVPGTGAGPGTLAGYLAAERSLASREARTTSGETPATPRANGAGDPARTRDNRDSRHADRPPHAEAAGEAPAREAPAREAPAREAPAREAPAREAPAGEGSTGVTSAGEWSTGDASAREAPAGEGSTGDVSAREAPAGEGSTGDVSAGTHPEDSRNNLVTHREGRMVDMTASHASSPHDPPETGNASDIGNAPTERSTVATIVFMDYPAPASVLAAVDPTAAIEGGSRLASLLQTLNEVNPSARITVTGHSYGSTVVGVAIQHEQVHVDAALLVASPGSLASSAEQLASAGCVTAMTSRSDVISAVAGARVTSTLGPDPSSVPFGAKVLGIRPGWDLWHAYDGYAANERSAEAIIAARNGTTPC